MQPGADRVGQLLGFTKTLSIDKRFNHFAFAKKAKSIPRGCGAAAAAGIAKSVQSGASGVG